MNETDTCIKMQVTRSAQKFPLSSEQCELLLDFEESPSLAQLSQKKGRDISVVSRQIQKLAQTCPVLEKRAGQWIITDLGREISKWSRKSILELQSVLNAQPTLRIAAPVEFASRILIPSLHQLIGQRSNDPSLIQTSIESLSQPLLEQSLLDGQIDFAFDCGRPENPGIKFKSVKEEPLLAVASPRLIKKHVLKSAADLTGAPHVRYSRIHAGLKLKLTHELSQTVCTFDTIATTRSAAIQSLGWALLPAYSIRDEIRDQRLKVIPTPGLSAEVYGVWWLRGNSRIENHWSQRAIRWLQKQIL